MAKNFDFAVTSATATTTSTSGDGCIKEQDRLLPIANVGRLMKQILPPNAKISKEAKETMQECVSEFIGFVTGEASEKCHKEKRKTINGEDICWALGTLGFDDHTEPLRRYLQKYREVVEEKSNLRNMDDTKNANDESPNFGSEEQTNQTFGPSSSKFDVIDINHSSTSRPF